jgi:hypothetical protein
MLERSLNVPNREGQSGSRRPQTAFGVRLTTFRMAVIEMD